VVDRVKVGNTFRAIRLELRLRQADVAERAGVSQQTVSDLECGHFGAMSVDTYCRIAAALDADIPLAPRWRGPKLDRILDRRHALLQNRAVELLTALGWNLATEVPFNRYGDRGSVDILGWRSERRALLIVEIKSEITSLEETLRVLNMKRRVVPIAMREERGWEARHHAALLILPDATTHRRLVKRHEALVSASLPDRGWDVRHWLNDPSGELRGLMFLPNTGRGGAMRKAPASRRVRRARAAGPGPKSGPHGAGFSVIERGGVSQDPAKPPPEPTGSPGSSPSSV
jgi:transcriptional regulator with XRE-family HTH domain